MQVILKARGAGKTTEAVRLVKEKNGLLLCSNRREAERLREVHGLKADQCMAWEEAKERGLLVGRANRPSPVVIDNVDIILTSMLGTKVDWVTITSDWPAE